jgi:hypothetical protein
MKTTYDPAFLTWLPDVKPLNIPYEIDGTYMLIWYGNIKLKIL